MEELTKALVHPERGDEEAAVGAEKGSKPAGKGSSLPSSTAGGASGGGRGGLRGLQDVRGEWRGAVQARGAKRSQRVTAGSQNRSLGNMW